jgi:hypothetical protein
MPEHGFVEEVVKDGKPFKRRIMSWFLRPGVKDKRILMLDGVTGDRVSRYIHVFTGRDGLWPNRVVSLRRGTDDIRVDPLAKALGSDARWFWCLSGIDMSEVQLTKGKRKGEFVRDSRVLLLVPDHQKEDFAALEERDPEGFRGRMFDVSRSTEKTSAVNGTSWYPVGKLSEAEMLAKFEEAAASYGLPPEKFIQPFDYAKVLPCPTFEELEKIANDFAGSEGVTGGSAVGGEQGEEESVGF